MEATITTSKTTILPEFVSNLVESVNCSSRIVLKTCRGTERAVDGIDDIATIMLSQQRQRLLNQLELA